MLDLRELWDDSAPPTEQFGETADAVEIRMPHKRPFRIGYARRKAAEANTNVFIELFA